MLRVPTGNVMEGAPPSEPDRIPGIIYNVEKRPKIHAVNKWAVMRHQGGKFSLTEELI